MQQAWFELVTDAHTFEHDNSCEGISNDPEMRMCWKSWKFICCIILPYWDAITYNGPLITEWMGDCHGWIAPPLSLLQPRTTLILPSSPFFTRFPSLSLDQPDLFFHQQSMSG